MERFVPRLIHFRILLLILFFLIGCHTLYSKDPLPENKGKRPKVGLVLSGGGAKGFAYVGLLKVIQEAGLRIDYIGGSSIGSIVGGLYAIGYSPDTIAKMIRSQDWDRVLRDIIDRKFMAYEEKEYTENAIISLPVKKHKISVSAGMYSGQEVSLLLNKYYSPAYKIHDFTKFQTPFLCIGTDLLTGEQVILDKGELPLAVRASMSIPGYFDPVEYHGNLLIDGGIVNNYPVKEVKDMGAAIVIGGDVQSGLYTKEELGSVTAIIDQVMSFHKVEANTEAEKLTDIHVRIKMDYGMMDFKSYDSIIAVGERVARAHFAEIKALADSLNAIEPMPIKKYTARPLDSVFINDVVIKGNKKMSSGFITAFLPKSRNSMVALDDLAKAIHRLSGTRFFEHISYELLYENGKTTLVIDAKDESPGGFSAAIHYDNDYSGSLLVNSAFRNTLGNHTKLFADLVLGINPRLKALYLVGLKRKSSIGVALDLYSFKFDTYDKDQKTNKIVFTNYKASLFYDRSFNNMYNLKAGIDYEYFRFKQDIAVDSVMDAWGKFVSYGTLFISAGVDTRDRAYFPTRGTKARIRLEYVMPWSKKDWVNDLFTNSAIAWLSYDLNVQLARRFVLQPGCFAGGMLNVTDSPPLQHLFSFGGLNQVNYVEQYTEFTGVKFLQQFGYYAAIVRLKLQYNLYKNLYLTARTDVGSNQTEFDQLFQGKNLIAGYGLTASYNSFIGPVSLTVMGSNINPKPLLFLNIGFWL